ncbi:MAG: hypothetical protein WAM95_03635 [Bacillus sp. (in: firmicutes)]
MMKERLYEGVPLKIAVVDELPSVREEQINFSELSLDELLNLHPNMYDAVFVMEDHLSEATNQKYIELYKEREIPFFFVVSNAINIPFMDLENHASYKEEADKVNDTQNFISGLKYVGKDEGYRGWDYSYPIKNNEIQRDNVEGIYSEVFKVVENESNESS